MAAPPVGDPASSAADSHSLTSGAANSAMGSSAARFFTQWLLATTAGWFLGIIAAMLLGAIAERLRAGEEIALGVGMGLGVGYPQSRIARRWFGTRSDWMWTSAAGLGTAFLIAQILAPRWQGVMPRLTIVVALGALMTGVGQRNILRVLSPRANWWIVACVASWGLAATEVLLWSMPPGALINIAKLMSGGVVLGVASGGVLVWILRPINSPA